MLFLLLVATLFRQRPPYSPRHTAGPYSPAPTVRWVQITEFWSMEGGKREIYRSLDGPGKPPSSTPNPFLFLPQLSWWLFVEEVRTTKWKEHGSHPKPSQASYPSETFAKDSEWVRNKPFFLCWLLRFDVAHYSRQPTSGFLNLGSTLDYLILCYGAALHVIG